MNRDVTIGPKGFGLLSASIVLGALAGFYLITVARDWTMLPDSILYVELADNLLEHGAYRTSVGPYGAVPPGFPLLLSAILSLVGRRWLAVNLVFALLAVVCLGMYTAYLGRLFRRPVALALTVVLAICLPFYWISRHVMTDVPFTLCVVLFAYALGRWRETGQRTWLAGTVLLAGANVALRSVGLILPIVMVVVFVRDWILRGAGLRRALIRSGLLGMLAVTPMVLLLVRNAMLPSGEVEGPPIKRFALTPRQGGDRPYDSIAELFRARAARGRLYVRTMLAEATHCDAFRSTRAPVAFGLAALPLGPGTASLIRRAEPLALFAVFYIPLVSAFPSTGSWHNLWRYLVPAMPGIILIVWRSADLVLERAIRRSNGVWTSRFPRSAAVAAGLAGVNLAAGWRELGAEVRAFTDRASHVYSTVNAARQTACWLDRYASEREPILARTAAIHGLTGRPWTPLPAGLDACAAVRLAAQNRMRWIVTSSLDWPGDPLEEALAARPETLRLRFRNDQWAVYEVLHAGQPCTSAHPSRARETIRR